jgi:hypothetical protein
MRAWQNVCRLAASMNPVGVAASRRLGGGVASRRFRLVRLSWLRELRR